MEPRTRRDAEKFFLGRFGPLFRPKKRAGLGRAGPETALF